MLAVLFGRGYAEWALKTDRAALARVSAGTARGDVEDEESEGTCFQKGS
ncbi:hypothetical protein [Streptomyces chryseus]